MCICSYADCRSRKSSSLALLDSPSSSKMKSSTEKVGSESESLSSGNKSGDNSPTQSPNSSKRLAAINAYQSAAVDGQSNDVVLTHCLASYIL